MADDTAASAALRSGPVPPEEPDEASRSSRRDALLLVALIALVVLPLLVAVGVLRQPRWYPQSDLAQTELRVRDVGTGHPPLTGLGGRIGPFGADAGSHPGPLSFWSLAPVYRLLGASSWALQVATVVLHAVAMGLTLWMARRRGGTPLAVAMAALLLVLVTCYGSAVLTVPWNPYVPVLWWMAALVAVWSLLEGDLAALPVAVVAVTFCTQTHISYLGLGGTLAVVGGAAVVAWLVVRRHDREAFRSSLRWTGVGTALAALLWFPPLAEQVTGSQGHNLRIIYRHFSHPEDPPAGFREGVDFLLSLLHPGTLLTGHATGGPPLLGGPTTPGVVLLVVWAVSVAVAGWLRHRSLLRLQGLLALLLVVSLVSTSRIFGLPFEYLALWGWGIGAMLLLAVGWTFAAAGARLLAEREAPVGPGRWGTAGTATLVVAAVVVGGLAVRSTVDAAHAETHQPEHADSLAVLSRETTAALASGDLPGTGRDERYLFTWNDTWYQVARAFALFNELDREGFDVGADESFQQSLTRHRVRTPDQATAQVHLAAGHDIDRWEHVPGARRIASYDPATPAERAEFARLEEQVLAEMEAVGVGDPVGALDRNPYTLRSAPLGGRPVLSPEGQERVARMIEIGPPVAVFVAPPDAAP